jgi:hypothetical protein
MYHFWSRFYRAAGIIALGELAVHLASYLHLGLTGLLIGILAYVATSSVKAKTTEARVSAVVAAQGATNSTVASLASTIASGSTGGAVFDSGNAINDSPTNASGFGATSGPSDTGAFNTGGQVGGAAAHYHVLPNFPEADHTHDFGGHYHFMGHTHPIT